MSRTGIFLSDLFEVLIEDDEIPERIQEKFPLLTQAEFSDALDLIWYLLSSLQHLEELNSVENRGNLDKK